MSALTLQQGDNYLSTLSADVMDDEIYAIVLEHFVISLSLQVAKGNNEKV